MGGGGRQERERAERERQLAAQNAQLMQQAQQVSPLQQAYEQAQLEFLNWDKSKGKDVRNAPGLNNYIQIGQAAMDRAERDRQGTGALALGAPGAEGYTENLKSLRKNEMGREFGAGLENALAGRRAEATGSVLPLATLNNSRNLGVLNANSQMLGTYMNRPQRQPWWHSLVGGLAQGVSYGSGGWSI